MVTSGTFQFAPSDPNFATGLCPRCASPVTLDGLAPYSENSDRTCSKCGARTSRYRLILQALSSIQPITWSLLASDIYIYDERTLRLGETVSYGLTSTNVAKWVHHQCSPLASSGERYIPTVSFYELAGFLALLDTQSLSQPVEDPPPECEVSWYRFGLTQLGAVPAWRQSLFGAATLIAENPAAAIVLIAAGFEAFFLETMRIAWSESHIDPAAFERLNRRNIPISQLVDWLPPVVGKRSLLEAPGDLHKIWEERVNRRRNDVVHRANVHLTSAEARDSMRAALDCIVFLDEPALVRPHSYYVNV